MDTVSMRKVDLNLNGTCNQYGLKH